MFYQIEENDPMPENSPVAIQPNNPIALLRALKGAAASCLLALAMHGAPATAGWLEHMTGYSPNTVGEALQVLLELGLAQRRSRNGGFEIAPEVRALLSGLGGAGEPIKTPEADSGVAQEFGVEWDEGLESSERAMFLQTETENPVEAEEYTSPDSDSVSAEASHDPLLEVSRVLHATLSLFGEPVHGPPERYPDAWLLLATIAEAYDRRHRLRNPARVVYANLKNGSLPATRYRENPAKYLPGEFLRQIGLPEPEQRAGYGGWECQEADEARRQAPLPPPSPHGVHAMDLPASRDGRRTAHQVWQTAQAILSERFSLQTYARMIAPLELVDFEAENALFTFAAPDDYQRRWLEARCTRVFVQILGGICNREARVKFTLTAED